MRKLFNRKLWKQIIAITLVLALNLGSLDGMLRFALQEVNLGNFTGFVRSALARAPKVEKNKNTLPDTAGPKQRKNPLAEKAQANQEITAKRTANSKTYQLTAKEFKTEVYQTPIHYSNENNELVDIDNTLVEAKSKTNSYSYENRSNSVKVRFSEKSNGKKLGQIQQNQASLEWSLLNTKEATGSISRNTITYSGVSENTDLRYIIDGFTLKEELVLANQAAPAEFKFLLNLKNLTYQAKEDGTIEFTDPSTGKLVWVMPKPYMYDAQGAVSEAVTAILTNNNQQLVLTVKADQQWLAEPNRQY
ncbi:MAG: hypothetical protein ACYC4E_02515, partial [Carboxydocellales bacterium]